MPKVTPDLFEVQNDLKAEAVLAKPESYYKKSWHLIMKAYDIATYYREY
ncbi:MAG: hypothetical protein KF746_13495 [Chitinophagaceae bacterium]|nr:hypothetical protein [Chitinophagaceae bacterium]